MTEISPNVYDLVYPSPAPLKQLSLTALGVQLWRWKLRTDSEEVVTQYGHNLNYWYGRSFKSIMPDIPSMICNIIEEFTKELGFSLFGPWFTNHLNTTFVFNCLVSQIHDIMTIFMECCCDCGGIVNYVQTAKRMMLCDLLSEREKFKTACMYCFEDDIRRMWPSISNKKHSLHLDIISFDVFPNLYYWIYFLENKLEEMPAGIPLNDVDIAEVMLDRCESYNCSAFEYFWSRISSERRSEKALDLYYRDKELFCRFVLPRLYESELDRFVAEKGDELIIALLRNEKSNHRQCVLPTWFYIRSKMKENNFIRMVERILRIETNRHIAESALRDRLPQVKQRFSTEHETFLCCEIWKSANYISKRSAVRTLLRETNDAFRKEYIRPSEPREVKFLLTVLSNATSEERVTFWCNNWHNLIVNSRIHDLHRIMLMCLKNETEITRFKETFMTEYENIRPYCVDLLVNGYFVELDEFLTFSCSADESKKRDLKKRLLQLNLIGEGSILHVLHFGRVRSMCEFIQDAFVDPNLVADFKNQLASLPVIDQCLFECIRFGYFPCAVEFVETFVPKESRTQLKQHFIEWLRNHLMTGFVSDIRVVYLQHFLVWCLGNDDAVYEFKDSISVHEVFNNMVEDEMSRATFRNGPMMYPRNLDQFLMWYFNTPEEIDDFKKQYSEIFRMFPSI